MNTPSPLPDSQDVGSGWVGLLPCPFCGETPTLNDYTDKPAAAWVLAHKEPGCIVRLVESYASRERALTVWNRRAAPPPPKSGEDEDSSVAGLPAHVADATATEAQSPAGEWAEAARLEDTVERSHFLFPDMPEPLRSHAVYVNAALSYYHGGPADGDVRQAWNYITTTLRSLDLELSERQRQLSELRRLVALHGGDFLRCDICGHQHDAVFHTLDLGTFICEVLGVPKSSEAQSGSRRFEEACAGSLSTDEPSPPPPAEADLKAERDRVKRLEEAAWAVVEDASPNSDRALAASNNAAVEAGLILKLRAALQTQGEG